MRGYLLWLLPLAAIWGASYLFIKVAGRELQPTTMMSGRVAVAAVALLLVLWSRSELGALRRAPIGAYALGITNAAVPFTLIAWGERHVDSGVAAIANSTMPIFVAALAIRFRPAERATGSRLLGIMLGLAGVAVLTGGSPGGGWWGVAGTLAIVLSSVAYAVGTLWGQHLIGEVSGPVLSTAALIGAAVVLLPFGVVEAPAVVPGWKTIGCVVALGVLGGTVAQLLWFGLLRRYGSSRASLVSYLLPVTALLYGALLLDERITVSALAGLVLILGGVALGAGAVRLPQRALPTA